MCPKLLIIIGNNQFWILDTNFSHFSPKKAKKNVFSDPNFGPGDDKNAIETRFQAILRPQKSMGGIVIAIWEKSNFFGSIGSLKCTKNAIFLQGGQNLPPPASCRVNLDKVKIDTEWVKFDRVKICSGGVKFDSVKFLTYLK